MAETIVKGSPILSSMEIVTAEPALFSVQLPKIHWFLLELIFSILDDVVSSLFEIINVLSLSIFRIEKFNIFASNVDLTVKNDPSHAMISDLPEVRTILSHNESPVMILETYFFTLLELSKGYDAFLMRLEGEKGLMLRILSRFSVKAIEPWLLV